jgi:Tol biopolymer transport system component
LFLLAVVAFCAVPALWLPTVSGAAVPGHGRAWELVSSADMNGVPVVGARAWSADGDQILIWSRGALPGASAGDLFGHARAVRTPEGWGVTPVANRYTLIGLDFTYPLLLAVTSDLSTSLWASPYPLLPGAPSEPTVGVYRRGPDGTLELLGSVGDRNAFSFTDATEDLHHAVFSSTDHLLPADAGRSSGSGAYELFGPTLRLVSVDDTGAAFPCGASIGSVYGDAPRVLSADGRRIFFTASPACGDRQRVYVREDGERTIDLSTSRCTRPDCNAPQDVTLSGATVDGAQVLLTTRQQLINNDTDDVPDLYARRLSDGALRRVSEGPTGQPADVYESARASDDGRRIYFAANGVLVPGEGEDGRVNVYLSDHGTLRFVATMDVSDDVRTLVTPDGGTLVFATSEALLPGDLDTNVDIYRYDAVSGALTLASLGDAGRGNASLDAGFLPQGMLGVLPHQRARSLSDDGRVFFSTTEALLPEDRNETSDVYEYANGKLGLITSGTAGKGTAIIPAGLSADGRSVFFVTDESLLPVDLDNGDPDVYVARVGGGIPDPAPPAPRCTGDACQGPPAPRAIGPSPDSVTAEAEAEVVPPPAPPFGLRVPSAQVRRQLAATGKARLAVDVPAAGRLALVARARTAGARKAIVVGRANATPRRAVTAHLTLRLSRAARRTLKARGSLMLTLSVRHSRLGPASSLQVKLTRPAVRSRTGAAR